jgi:acetylornithine aminotransferase
VALKNDSAKEVETRCLADGVLLNAATPNVVRLAPPLVITEGELSAALDVLVTAIDRSVK